MAQLADAKARLAAVQSRLAELQAGFDESLAKKAELEAKAQRCETQLTNAGRLLGKRVPLRYCEPMRCFSQFCSALLLGLCVLNACTNS
jgi:hypothetical protein